VENQFRTRVLRPLAITFGVLLAMLAFIGVVASTLLWNTKNGALVIAALAAAGILFIVSLVTSQDRLTLPQRSVAVLAAAVPLLVGGLYGMGVLGDIDDDERNINVQPLLIVPDDAPVVYAENSVEFCMVDEGGACEPIDEWEVAYQGPDEFVFVFENLEAGVAHNVAIFELEDGGMGDLIHGGQIFEGVDEAPEFVDDDDDRAMWLKDIDELDRIADSAILLVREESGKSAPESLRLDMLVSELVDELRTLSYDVTLTRSTAGVVRASSSIRSEWSAREVQTFCPFTIHSSPTSSAWNPSPITSAPSSSAPGTGWSRVRP
jgi:hypothetical protein